MDSQQQEEHQVGVEQDIVNLQKQINELKGKTDSPFTTAVTINPFSKLGKLNLEQGSTGEARFRKIPVDVMWNSSRNEQISLNTHGNWSDGINILHLDFASSGTTTRWAKPVIVPDDCVPNSKASLKWIWITSSNSGNVRMNISVDMYNEKSGSIGETLLLDSTPILVVAPSVINTIKTESIDFTTTFSAGDYLSVYMQRTADNGDDTCTGSANMFGTWIEYLAYN